ncbi:hypothetical protein [Puniceicoccus vermicola]|uniref:Uncharacterized protein n=1 Tax=Puniceicoccus vermicola TaxID=388746 RepID=A0A7X1AX08_9BACT|nr:hypothetical protein [Puniceicoccus vermicola]MBC2600598.1 hypothetical protein [Puniceicoccus vermicola]
MELNLRVKKKIERVPPGREPVKEAATASPPPSEKPPEPEKSDDEEVDSGNLEDTTDYSPHAIYGSDEEDSNEPPPDYEPPKPKKARKPKQWEDGEHIDLEAAVAEASDLPVSVNELEALIAKTPPELRKFLEDEFSAEFLGPIVVDPKKLD